MGTQIYVKRKDMEATGWEHNPFTETYESDEEVFSEHICYYTHKDYDGLKLWSYADTDFCADYNAWGSNKPKLDSLGISNLPHHLG